MVRVLSFIAALLLFIPASDTHAQGWFPQASGTSHQLYGVSFASGTHGVAVGVSGTIRRTTNGGTNWTGVSSGTSATLYEVVFVDASTGWIVGVNGTILKTTNGGTSWGIQSSGTSATLTCINFTSPLIGTAVGSGGVIRRTTDGGNSWTGQSSGTSSGLWGVSFVDANTGTAVGENGMILRTTNGGTTWTTQASGTTSDLWEVSMTGSSTAYVVGNGGLILRTTNGGTTWTSHSSGTGVPLYHVFFRTPSKGTVVGVSGTILHTTDAGTTWSGQSSGVSQPLQEVVFSDEHTGTAVGGSGTIIRTLTGGVTCPSITINPVSLAGGTIGVSYAASLSASGGISPYAFAITSGLLPPGLVLSPTGAMSGTPTATGTYAFTVTTYDNNNCQGIRTYTISIQCSPLSILPGTLTNGTVDVAYNAALTASGGVAPYTFTIQTGGLPSGLTLSSGGLISGTPAVAGTSTFTILVSDAAGCTTTVSYALSIDCPSVTLVPASLPTGTAGMPYSQTLGATGGSSPYSFAVASGTLPPGISLSASGVLSGTPASVGTSSCVITATDVQGCAGSAAYSIVISCPVVNLAPSSVPGGSVGISYSVSLTATGGGAPYSFSITSGSLPPGLLLSPGGLLSGTPVTSGSFSFTVTATDAQACSGTLAYVMSVACPTIQILPAGLAAGVAGVPYTQTLSALGGAPPFTFAVTSGTLPAGLAMSSAGLITGTPTSPGSSNITVTVTDNQSCTGTTNYTLTIGCPVIAVTPASFPTGTIGLPYSASFSSTGGNSPYTYAVTSGALPVGMALSVAGVLSGTPSAPGSFAFTVTATDASGCEGTVAATMGVNCAPISLSGLTGGVVGTAYSQTVTASGGTAPYAFAVTSGFLPSGLSLSTAGVVSGTPTSQGSYSFTIAATDGQGCQGSQSYSISFVCPPINLSSLPGGSVGSSYTASVSVVGGTAPYTFAVTSGSIPPGLSLSGGGTLAGVPVSGGMYTFTMTATDVYGCTGSEPYAIAISCPPISLAPSSLPNGSVGVPYSQSMSAAGGTAPHVFAVTSGAIPPGLSLSGAGLLSGVPSGNGLYAFVVTANDAYGCSGTQSYSIEIGACPTIAISPASLPAGSEGSLYSQTLSSAGGTGPYTYALSLGVLPPGLSLTAGGVLSGIPASGGVYQFTISSTDNAGCLGFQSYAMVVCGTITLTSLSGGTTGVAYSEIVGTTGGTAPFTFSLSSGSLPPGISFASSGLIAGVPTTAGSYAFTIDVTDANGCMGNAAYSIQIICPTLSVGPSILPQGQSGSPYTQALSTTGGTAPYLYSQTGGSLPAGMSLSSAGVISGVATATGSFSFTVQVVDAFACPASAAFTLDVVCPSISILPAALPSAFVGSSYADVITAAGGSSPYTFSIIAGALPPGITLSPSGVVGGTPSASGSFAFTVQALDAAGCIGTTYYTFQVACPAIALNPPTLPGGSTGAAYHQTLTGIGGAAPYAYAVTAGSLPAGLVLSAGGVLSGTPLVPGSYAFDVTVTDAPGCTGTQSYAIAISCPAITATPASLPSGLSGIPFSLTLGGTGGNPPYVFAVTAGSLPRGLSLSGAGILSGTPDSVGTTACTVTVTDASGCTGSKSYTMTITCPSFTVTPADLPGGTAGYAYSQQLSATGGAAPYSYSLASGMLPPGLVLSTSGLISGSPTASGSSSFTVLVTDAQGCTAIKSYATAVLCPTLGILPVSLPAGIAGSAYSVALTGIGGTAPYAFAVTSGLLPPGLSLSASGVLSGVPVAQSVSSFIVGVTDANGCQGSQPYIVVVSIAPVCSVVPDSIVFGGILVGESDADTVVVSNTGSGPLTIYSASSTSGHFNVSPLQATVPAGNNQEFIVTFAPGSTGPKAAEVLFTHNAPSAPDSVHLLGTGTAPVFTVFTMISFGQVHLGMARVDSVRIVNTGSTTLTISSVVTDHGEFSVFPGSASLPPGASQVFLVVFVPSSIGSKGGNIIFTHNAIGSPSLIPFSGTGIVNVIVRKYRDADGESMTPGDRFPKRWQLSLYRSEILPANLVASADTSELVVPLTDVGVYIAVEADSGGAWRRLNGNLSFADTLLVDGTVSVADTFVNFRRNTISIRQLEDLDGNFGSSHDRVVKSWYLELRRDSVTGPIVASGYSGSLVVPNLGDGVYYAIRRDTSGWTTIGSVRNGLATSDTSCSVMIMLTEGSSPEIDFLLAREEYFITFRSFTPEELGQKIPVKKKPHAVRFCADFVNRVGGRVDGLNVTFYSTGLTSNVTTMESFAPFTSAASYSGKLWQFGGAWIANGETVTVCAVANKHKTVSIASWNWTVNGLPLDKQPAFKPSQQIRLLPMPNFANVRNELYTLGTFNPTGGMIIGIPNPGNPKAQGWVRMRSSRAVQRSLADRGLRHTANNHGFDRFSSGKPFIKELKELLPKKHNNKLFAEAVALRAGIYASAIGMTPPGFAELVYDEQPANALCGLTLLQISQKVDSALSLWDAPAFLGWDYPLYTSVVEKINRAFEGAMDTVQWNGTLRVRGVRRLVDAPFLHPNPGAIPFRIDRAAVAELQPKAFELLQNYPNPFNPTTTIEFDLVDDGFVTLRIYNVLGQEVATILDREEMAAGRNDVELNAAELPTGVYFYRMTVESIRDEGGIGEVRHVDTRKMMLVK